MEMRKSSALLTRKFKNIPGNLKVRGGEGERKGWWKGGREREKEGG